MTTYHEARNEMDRLRREDVDLTMTVNPADYESIGQARHRQGRQPSCHICGGAGFVRFPFPVEHKWFGQAIACECSAAHDA